MSHETVRLMTQGQLKDIVATMIGAIPDLSFDEAQHLIGEKGRFVDELQPAFRKTEEISTFSVSVDYDRKVADVIADGHYDWMHSDITDDHFPSTRSGKCDLEIELVHFGRVISTEDAIKEMAGRGLHPAELSELLALGATRPDLQRESPIVALGSVWRDSIGSRNVPYLYRYGSERYLNLDWLGDGWHEVCRFAAVRN